MSPLRVAIAVVSIIVVVSLVGLYYYSPIADSQSANIPVRPNSYIASIANSDTSKLGMMESTNNSASVTRDGVSVTFETTVLTSHDAGESGMLLSVLYNGETAGSVLLVVNNFENSSQYTFIPIFSSVLIQSETFNTSLSLASSTPLVASNGSDLSVTPAAQFLPVGTYSSGWLGWAYSFNNYNTQGLMAWLVAGAAVSVLVVLLATAGLGWPIAAIVAAVLVASAAVLGLINWMGGYQGIYYAESTNWMAAFYGHPPAWISYNPVPGGY
jgi:hypothetical protein